MAALTRRERKVKDILLKELADIEEVGGLSYVQKQRLEKRIDHEYIDEELATMRESLDSTEWWRNAVMAVTALSVMVSAALLLGGQEFSFNHVQWPLIVGIQAATLTYSRRSTQRRIFIYEALRELSDADEEGVQLGRAIEEADELIDRIVRRELGEDALPEEKPRQKRTRRVPEAPFGLRSARRRTSTARV